MISDNEIPKRAGSKAPTPSPSSARSPELDIIKGGLVVIMLLYHCTDRDFFPFTECLRSRIHFIHFAFLGISGFLCGYHYANREAATLGSAQRRLTVRAGKLLLLFLLTNLALCLAGQGATLAAWRNASAGWQVLFLNLVVSVNGSLVSFEILYLIALFLLTAGCLLRIGRNGIWLLPALATSVVYLPGTTSLFMGFGCLAMWAGMLLRAAPGFTATAACGHRLLLAPGLLAIHLAVSPALSSSVGRGWIVPFYAAETCLWGLSFLAVARFTPGPWAGNVLSTLGRYTLLAYLVHLPLARILLRVWPSDNRGTNAAFIAVLLISISATYLTILFVAYARKRFPTSDRFYRAVFE